MLVRLVRTQPLVFAGLVVVVVVGTLVSPVLGAYALGGLVVVALFAGPILLDA